MLLVAAAVAAFCEADVIGVGRIDVEADYLPHVVACENGAAGQAALEAQAIAARSYLYDELARFGSIPDGQGSQVYSCGNAPNDDHRAAVAATARQVLRYRDTQVVAFYVAGARGQAGPACRGSTEDPTNTERFVTYNEGLTGDGVVQSPLGLVDPANLANRGCMSQNGADCLSDAGRSGEDILRFYYGADVELVTADGACMAPPSDAGCSTSPGGSTLWGIAALLLLHRLRPAFGRRWRLELRRRGRSIVPGRASDTSRQLELRKRGRSLFFGRPSDTRWRLEHVSRPSFGHEPATRASEKGFVRPTVGRRVATRASEKGRSPCSGATVGHRRKTRRPRVTPQGIRSYSTAR